MGIEEVNPQEERPSVAFQSSHLLAERAVTAG